MSETWSGLLTAHTVTCGDLDIMWENVKPFSLPWVWVRLSVVLPLLSSYLHLIRASCSAFPNKIFHISYFQRIFYTFFPIRNFSCNAQQSNIWNGLQHALLNPLDMQSLSIIFTSLPLLAWKYYSFLSSFIHSFWRNTQELWFLTLWRMKFMWITPVYKNALPIAQKTQVVSITKPNCICSC